MKLLVCFIVIVMVLAREALNKSYPESSAVMPRGPHVHRTPPLTGVEAGRILFFSDVPTFTGMYNIAHRDVKSCLITCKLSTVISKIFSGFTLPNR